MSETDFLKKAREAIRAGNKALGRHFLQQALALNSQSEIGWLWMSAVVDDPREQRRCLERVIEINPNNEKAKKGLPLVDAHIGRMSQLVPIDRTRDRQDPVKRIHGFLVDGEVLQGLYDLRGGGFIGITDARLIFMAQGLVLKSRTVVSVPYTRITAIGARDTGKSLLGSFLGSSTLTVTSGNREWSFEFSSGREAYQAYQIIMKGLLEVETGEE